MQISDNILSRGEKNALQLCELFYNNGFDRVRLDRFDDYALYAGNREFLGGADIVTFTGADGRLMALRPDVTLSVSRSANTTADLRLYYHENVFRRSGLSREFRILNQCGIERFGNIDSAAEADTIALAWKSMRAINITGAIIDISHALLFSALAPGLSQQQTSEIARLMSKRNGIEIKNRAARLGLSKEQAEIFMAIALLYGGFEEVVHKIRKFNIPAAAADALNSLEEIVSRVRKIEPDADIKLDISLSQDVSYYSGVIFQVIAGGFASPIVSGGRYDSLLRRLGKYGGAVGFAIYIDKLTERRQLTIDN